MSQTLDWHAIHISGFVLFGFYVGWNIATILTKEQNKIPNIFTQKFIKNKCYITVLKIIEWSECFIATFYREALNVFIF